MKEILRSFSIAAVIVATMLMWVVPTAAKFLPKETVELLDGFGWMLFVAIGCIAVSFMLNDKR